MDTAPNRTRRITHLLNPATNLPQALIILSVIALISGVATGFILSRRPTTLIGGSTSSGGNSIAVPAQQEQAACRDFAEGTIKSRPKGPDAGEYTEGTHLLDRGAGQYPVALTSSNVDLSAYEGKKVKVFGETQKALKEGWLMDVCKVEEK